jgi:uncharacterized membrane protein HdeD (DUF308 family)
MQKEKNGAALSILTAVILIIAGILIIIWPDSMIMMLTKVLGAFMAAAGLVQFIKSLTDPVRNPFKTAAALCLLVFGCWVFFFPDPITKFMPVVLGILLIAHGIDTCISAGFGKKAAIDKWWILLLLALLSMVMGIICIVFCEWFRTAGMILLGLFLLYDGISSIVVFIKVLLTQRHIKKNLEGTLDEIDDYQ